MFERWIPSRGQGYRRWGRRKRGYKKGNMESISRPNIQTGGAEAIGAKVYQVAMAILRDIGNDAKGRKINSRGTAEKNVDV